MALNDRTFFVYPTVFGPITIGATGDAVTTVVLGEETLPGERRASSVANRCATEIMEYLAGKRTAFTVTAAPAGSAFQRRVWQAAEHIPYGQTRTARELAEALGAAGSYRAVGAAAGRNPLALLVPTHRIVTGTGRPLGTGRAAEINAALLALERRATNL